MSVVAWDGRTIAADRQATCDGMRSECSKIWRLPSGLVAAAIGELEHGLVLAQWYQSGADPDKWPAFQKTDDWTRLIIASDEGVVIYEKEPVPQPCRDQFMAWGTGRDFAMGAMEMGADAIRAVEVAIKHNIYCGCGVESFDLHAKD